MSVLILQSHAPRVPAWIRRCTASVRDWAQASGYAYRLIGDELFAGVPLALTLKAMSRLPAADLGRLHWLVRLAEECERVVWIDADVLVFAPAALRLPDADPFVCREVLVRRVKDAAPVVSVGLNPTIVGTGADTAFLSRWIAAIDAHAARAVGLGDADFGRAMLAQIAPRGTLATIDTIGHFNAPVLREVLGHEGPVLRLMMQASGVAFAAANLCSHQRRIAAPSVMQAIDALLRTNGDVVNRHLGAP